MNFRKVILLICFGFLFSTTLAACENITHHRRCDERVAAPIVGILERGWTVECKPNFSSTGPDGVRHHAWTDPARKTVWVWPDNPNFSDKMLLKVLYHEWGHVEYIVQRQTYRNPEWWADAFAYCHMTPTQRSGLGFLLPKPSSTTCYLMVISH